MSEVMVRRIHEVSELLNEPEIECYTDTLEITGGYYNGCEVTVSFCPEHYAIFAVSYDDIHIHEVATLELMASIEDIEKTMLILTQRVNKRYKAKHG